MSEAPAKPVIMDVNEDEEPDPMDERLDQQQEDQKTKKKKEGAQDGPKKEAPKKEAPKMVDTFTKSVGIIIPPPEVCRFAVASEGAAA